MKEEEILSTNRNQGNTDKLKSAFLSNISHEIRTPMNTILGFATLMENDDLSITDYKEFSKIIKNSSSRLLNTLNDLIEISRIEVDDIKCHFEDINVNTILHDIEAIYGLEANKKGLKFIFDKNEVDNLVINTDFSKLATIIRNFIDNAIKYTDKGSVTFGYRQFPEHIEFYVKDTGIGIAHQNLDLIFDKFGRINQNGFNLIDGIGLGLTIAKAYSILLHGNIQVESNLGAGSVFKLVLPYKRKLLSKKNNFVKNNFFLNIFSSKNRNILIDNC